MIGDNEPLPLGKSPGGSALRNGRPTIEEVLRHMVLGTEESLVLVRNLVTALRPRSRRDPEDALRNWRELLDLLRGNASYRQTLAETLFALLAERDQRSFYTDSGLLPNSGFFSELRQILARKLLPEPIDNGNFQSCLRLVFAGSGVLVWLPIIPLEERDAFWQLLAHEAVGSAENHQRIREQLIVSALILGHRIAAMGLEPELLRTVPRLTRGESPFIALCDEVTRLAGQLRACSMLMSVGETDARHLDVLLDQCRDAVDRVHQATATRGTSFALTFLVVRLRQHLERLELLLGLLTEPIAADDRISPIRNWSSFVAGTIENELQRDCLRQHTAKLTALVSLRAIENAGRTGEHYIATNRAEWCGMWRAAGGAGFLIALMAMIKIFGGSLHLPLLNQGLLNGAIYAGGFVIIHLCHGTVATKQPAMTAATIAATVSQTRGRLREIDRLAELIVATVRSQHAAIAGNVLVALPLAVALIMAMQLQLGSAVIAPDKALTMLKELDPLGGAPFFAAVAGLWLFMAGLVSGYVDNQAAYGGLRERVACHPWLTRVLGRTRATRLGAYLDQNAGGLTGNIFFGMMLGLTPAIGLATGLPVDIRHIAFSAANFGYALTALDFHVEPLAMLRGAVGVLLIGVVNLTVSFSLALWVALRSRGVDFTAAGTLLPELRRRLRSQPLRFLLPPRERLDEG
jgi:site-specific recombinase